MIGASAGTGRFSAADNAQGGTLPVHAV